MTIEEKRQFLLKNFEKISQEDRDFFEFNFACVYTRNSISIEHGKKEVPLAQVMDIVKGRPVDCSEELKRSVYNHYCAFLDVKEYASNNVAFTEDLVKNVHTTLTKGLNDIPGGLYRNVDIRIAGSNHIPPSYLKVYDRMRSYFLDVADMDADPITQACYAHLQLAKIHPFLDGNGRTSRLMLNFILMKNGYLPISISVKKRLEYFTLVEEFKVNKNAEPFIEFIRSLVDSEYDRMISMITIQNH